MVAVASSADENLQEEADLKIVTSLPHRVVEHEHVWIPMSDGCRLAAKIWLPEGAANAPVPAILEYIPYRKRDLTAVRDAGTHAYFAGHGYACVRVDLRGSGESEGVLRDEYLPVELSDGCEVLRWIAGQPWCDGAVGMMGISWGGFNGLQIAALQPPELKAVIALSFTDDRYADDVHYMGGCLLSDNLSWASTMFDQNTHPPDPELVNNWRERWFERLEGSGLWLETWLRHQHRDAYWQHGSICEDYAAVECPVFAVSGWADGYSNAVFRVLAHLSGPRKGLIGPWSHRYPHLGVPGPAINFLHEALRWWDRWLKGIDTGVMDEPMVRVWMQDSVVPRSSYVSRPGRWVAEPRWPSPDIVDQIRPLSFSRLGEPGEVPEAASLTVQSPLGTGLFAGKWCSYSDTPDLPHDQRGDDGGSLVFDSAPLDDILEILGAPVVELELAVNRPVAMVAVRLSDLHPDDKATRVTYGLLNLTQRNSRESPEHLTPGERYRVRVQLNEIAQAFPRGHRLRLAISTSYWPLAWPPPEPVQLTVFTGGSTLTLPVRAPRSGDQHLADLGSPETAPPLEKTVLVPGCQDWRINHDLATDQSTLTVVLDEGKYRLESIDMEIGSRMEERYSFRYGDFDSVRGETHWERSFKRGDWSVRTVTRTVLTSTKTHFCIRADLDAFEGDSHVYCQSWDRTIPRSMV